MEGECDAFELKSFTRQGSRLIARGPGLALIFADHLPPNGVSIFTRRVRNYASLGNITLR